MNDEWQKKNDQELVTEAQIGSRGQGAPVEMIRRLKEALHKEERAIKWLTGVLVVLTFILVGLGVEALYPTARQPPPAATQQLPTATEVFHLQAECARLGENILNESVIGSTLTQSQVSRYNQKTNRCYVELTVQSADLTKPDGIMTTYLFDGQTKEMLAWDKFKNNDHVGMIFNYRESMGRNDALMYIDKMMRDD